MNHNEMVAIIVAIVAFTVIIVTFIGTRRKPAAGPGQDAHVEEMRALKERLATLERLVVEREHSLAREIDALHAPAPTARATIAASGVEVL